MYKSIRRWGVISVSFKMFGDITVFLRETKYYNNISYVSFVIDPLCNYTLLPKTVNMSETFLEVILWKPFQLFSRIPDYVSSITKSSSLQCWFHSGDHIKISYSEVRRVWKRLQCCHIVLCWDILDQNRPLSWTFSWRRNQILGHNFSGLYFWPHP